MGKLTTRDYWDSIYVSKREGASPPAAGKFKAAARKLIGVRRDLLRPYDDFLLWEVILKKHLPAAPGARALEVGSAPGNFLVKMSQAFGCIPFGVEYSESGAALNRQTFADNDIDPSNVIHADFLADDFQKRFANHFDVVVSRGFIEHFTDVRQVVAGHVNVLAPGGCLIISIPNLRGANRLLVWLFHRETLPMHNLGIMRMKGFRALFDNQGMSPSFCGRYGTFSFNLFNTDPRSPKRFLLALCQREQLVLNAAFRLLLGRRGAESGLFSPNLIFIGVKR